MSHPVEFNPRVKTDLPTDPSGPRQTVRTPDSGISFADQLSLAQGLKFSNHAQKRLQSREIRLSDDGLNRLADAVERAEKRGGRESLVLMDELAFIVNIPSRLVVTAMDASSRGEGVFTQIDSVVIADNKREV
jgi:flagellar operon protein